MENAGTQRMSDDGCKYWHEQQESKNNTNYNNVSSAVDHRARDNIRAGVLRQPKGLISRLSTECGFSGDFRFPSVFETSQVGAKHIGHGLGVGFDLCRGSRTFERTKAWTRVRTRSSGGLRTSSRMPHSKSVVSRHSSFWSRKRIAALFGKY